MGPAHKNPINIPQPKEFAGKRKFKVTSDDVHLRRASSDVEATLSTTNIPLGEGASDIGE